MKKIKTSTNWCILVAKLNILSKYKLFFADNLLYIYIFTKAFNRWR